MTSQEVIDYLKQYKYLDNNINRQLAEKEEWKARAEKITTVITGMPHGSSGENPREVAICKMIECDYLATKMIDEFVDMGIEIKRMINTVKDARLKLLLLYRYIDGKTWEQISVDLHYDIEGKNVYKMHKKAISLVEVSI